MSISPIVGQPPYFSSVAERQFCFYFRSAISPIALKFRGQPGGRILFSGGRFFTRFNDQISIFNIDIFWVLWIVLCVGVTSATRSWAAISQIIIPFSHIGLACRLKFIGPKTLLFYFFTFLVATLQTLHYQYPVNNSLHLFSLAKLDNFFLIL